MKLPLLQVARIAWILEIFLKKYGFLFPFREGEFSRLRTLYNRQRETSQEKLPIYLKF